MSQPSLATTSYRAPQLLALDNPENRLAPPAPLASAPTKGGTTMHLYGHDFGLAPVQLGTAAASVQFDGTLREVNSMVRIKETINGTRETYDRASFIVPEGYGRSKVIRLYLLSDQARSFSATLSSFTTTHPLLLPHIQRWNEDSQTTRFLCTAETFARAQSSACSSPALTARWHASSLFCRP